VYGKEIDTLYVPFNGNINASFDFTINFETVPSPDDSFKFRFSLYDDNLGPLLSAIPGIPDTSVINKIPFYRIGYNGDPNFVELSPYYNPVFSNPITKNSENKDTYTVHFEAVEPKKYAILIEIYNEAGSGYYDPEKHYVYLVSSGSDCINALPGKINSGAIDMGSGQREWRAYYLYNEESTPPFDYTLEADF
jgi:hypothetical protein